MFNDIYLIFSFYLRGDKATWSSILFSSEKSKTQLSTNDCQDMGTKICYIVPESGESDIGSYFYIFLDCILISKFIREAVKNYLADFARQGGGVVVFDSFPKVTWVYVFDISSGDKMS